MNTEIKMWCGEQVHLSFKCKRGLRDAHLNDAQKCNILWSGIYANALSLKRDGTPLYPNVRAAYMELSEESKKVFDEYIKRTIADIKELCDHIEYIILYDAMPQRDASEYDFYRILTNNHYSVYANKYGLLLCGIVKKDKDTNTEILAATPLTYYFHLDTHSSNSFRMSTKIDNVKYVRSRVIAMFNHGLRTLSGKRDNRHNDRRVVDHLIYLRRFKIFDEYTRVISPNANVSAHANDERENLELGVTYNTTEVTTLPEWITRPSP